MWRKLPNMTHNRIGGPLGKTTECFEEKLVRRRNFFKRELASAKSLTLAPVYV